MPKKDRHHPETHDAPGGPRECAPCLTARLPGASASNDSKQVMVMVGDKTFRCPECGANVFTKRGGKFTCNGCGARYVGE